MQEVIENLAARTNGAFTTITVDDHLKTGLSNEDATKVLEQVGPNALEPPAKKSIWELWLQQFDGKDIFFSSVANYYMLFCVIDALTLTIEHFKL